MNNTEFFRFPHTPHILWLGKDEPRDDKLLSNAERDALLAGEVVVEEKLDGANLGISLAPDGQLQVQNRGQYLIKPYAGQFSRLDAWLAIHQAQIEAHLAPHLMLFGEWCAARHTLDYAALPDWFMLFDVYDREQQRFYATPQRNALAEKIGLRTVPQVLQGRVTLAQLTALLASQSSHYRAGPLEGMVIRRESGLWCEQRAKLVRADFTQSIAEHWRNRRIEWNQLHYPE